MISQLREMLLPFPRVQLVERATPIQKLENLGRELSYVTDRNIFVKRDDVMALGGGGNKLRKLEFALGAALAEGANTLVTVGGLQSNHARLTAAAAAKAGLACEIILGRAVPRRNEEYELGGNVFLDKLFGAKVEIVADRRSPLERARERVDELKKSGRNPYLIPTGGSTPVGALGYVNCLFEILEQEQELGLTFDHIVLANGSSGTHAGLAAGAALAGRSPDMVRSFSTLAPQEVSHQTTSELVNGTLKLLGHMQEIAPDDICVDGSQRGEGYGIPTDEMKAALLALARTEAILVDPVYSGKAFAGMLAAIRNGHYQPDANILFVMTGGAPSLYAYRDAFE